VKPAPFELHAPTTVAEASGLLTEYGDEAKPLAGGQSLVPMLALRLTRFEHLVDLNGVEGFASIGVDSGRLRIGAGTRQATVGRDRDVARDAPLLSRATPLIGHFQIRNRGTIGGSVAHADPASEYPAAVLALDAELEITSTRGARLVHATDFFTGMWTTALEPDELLSAIVIPPRGARRGEAIEEVARRHGDFALAGVAVWVRYGGLARVGLMGVAGAPVVHDVRSQLDGGASARDVADELAQNVDPSGDMHASAAYRRRLVRVLVTRCLTEALGRD
jgi:carbon-monoxide dehydrogenase medium subunit